MACRVTAQAVDDIDAIWLYVATESGSADTAQRLVDSLTRRFLFLANYPYAGRSRTHEFGSGRRSFAVGEYVILYAVRGADVLVLRVLHGRRDLEGLLAP